MAGDQVRVEVENDSKAATGTENDIRWTGESALYATITVFAAASVIVSFAKVPFKVSVDAFVPSLDLFLLATGLVFYGVLNLWSLIPDQKATLLGVAALVLMCVPIGWFAWKYIDISNLVRVHLARVNTNPLDSSLPRVGRAHLGIDHLVYRNGGFPIIGMAS